MASTLSRLSDASATCLTCPGRLFELATLRRVAEALDCTLVYALVPNKPLETTLRDRARAFRRRRRGPVEHSMLLEDQKVTAKDAEARLDEIVRETNPRLFWD
jgi:hypothetical protein